MDKAHHILNFIENLDEIDNLLAIHREVSGAKRGRRKPNVQTLNKSAIVLLTACWESYIEELISAAFDFLITNSNNHSIIPYSVLTRASNELKNDKDARRVWELADNGWKDVLKRYKKGILDKEVDFFHVPRPTNIDELFEKLIGMQSMTSDWKWKGRSNENIKVSLNEYIDLRGKIAHKVRTDDTVLKRDVREYRELLKYLAVISHNRTNAYLRAKTGQSAWTSYGVGKTK